MQKLVCSGAASPPIDTRKPILDSVAAGMLALSQAWGGVALKALQNIATALFELGHLELSSGYAHLTAQLVAFLDLHNLPQKAHYRAAQCCVQLQRPLAALHCLSQVRVRMPNMCHDLVNNVRSAASSNLCQW